jgi:hypothetical protein
VALATLGVVVLSRRCLWAQAPTWTLPLVLFAWVIVTTLYRPSITPDQPWASRRLVPVVLPGFILLAVWGSSWLGGRLRQMRLDRVLYVGLACCCVALLVVPATITTFGLKARSGGPVGIKVVADGLALTHTYQGEIQAVDSMCAAIPRNSSVVFLAGVTANWLPEVVRGMCGDPAAVAVHTSPAAVDAVVHGIERAGRRPVIVAGVRSRLAVYGGRMSLIMKLRTDMDPSTLTTPPLTNWPISLNVWMLEPTP